MDKGGGHPLQEKNLGVAVPPACHNAKSLPLLRGATFLKKEARPPPSACKCRIQTNLGALSSSCSSSKSAFRVRTALVPLGGDWPRGGGGLSRAVMPKQPRSSTTGPQPKPFEYVLTAQSCAVSSVPSPKLTAPKLCANFRSGRRRLMPGGRHMALGRKAQKPKRFAVLGDPALLFQAPGSPQDFGVWSRH